MRCTVLQGRAKTIMIRTDKKDAFHKKISILFAMAAVSFCIFGTSAFGASEEYVLQPGDEISVNVIEHPEFSGRHKIRPDGPSIIRCSANLKLLRPHAPSS